MAPGNPACLHFPESARTPSPRTFMSYNSFPDQGVYRKMYSELRRRDLDEHREYGPVHVFENQELVNPRERAAADHAEQQEPVVGPNTAAEEQVDPNTPRVHDIENGDGVTRDAKITVIDLSSESNDSGSPTRLSEAEADATTSAEKEPPKTPEHRIIRSMASPPAGARRRLSYSSDRKTDDYSSSTNCSNCNHQLKKLGKSGHKYAKNPKVKNPYNLDFTPENPSSSSSSTRKPINWMSLVMSSSDESKKRKPRGLNAVASGPASKKRRQG